MHTFPGTLQVFSQISGLIILHPVRMIKFFVSCFGRFSLMARNIDLLVHINGFEPWGDKDGKIPFLLD